LAGLQQEIPEVGLAPESHLLRLLLKLTRPAQSIKNVLRFLSIQIRRKVISKAVKRSKIIYMPYQNQQPPISKKHHRSGDCVFMAPQTGNKIETPSLRAQKASSWRNR
jgi:hypothetical protein